MNEIISNATKEELLEAPLSIRINSLKATIINAINESEIPVVLVGMIFNDMNDDIKKLCEQQTARDYESFTKLLKDKKE